MSSKRYRQLKAKIEDRKYLLKDAADLVSEMKSGRTDQTVDIAIRLGVDPKQSDQQVRGAVNLPHGLGTKVRVLAFVKAEKEAEARSAGADFVGGDDLVEKITGGWMEFDKVVATPDMMPIVSKVGKILGPRGFMPNPKTGTVSFEIGKAISECKAGKASFKTDKGGVLHCAVGKVSFGGQKIAENVQSVLEGVVKLKPAASKGTFLKSVTLSATTSPGIKIDVGELL